MSTPVSSPKSVPVTGEFNTLVISDLHLGEDLTAVASEANTLHINIVEAELIGFLRYYARRREDGRAWRLIINGDMVDFLSVVLLPSHPDFEGYKANVEEHEFGLRRTPQAAISKMHAVLKRHAGVFQALARFLSRGNRVEIISGNHDTEFHWKGTQDALIEGVSEAWEGMHESERPGALLGEEVVAGISFHPWFFYEPGVLWVEHGHQYDECCSLRYQLYPRCPNTDDIVTNVDTAGVRYVTVYVAEAEAQNMDLWGFTGYLRFGFGLGVRGCLRLAYGYYTFAKVLMQVWRAGGKKSAAAQEVREEHDERLIALAEKWEMPTEKLLKLNGLGRLPVVSQFSKLSSVLMLDKLAFFALGMFIAVFSLIFLGGALALAGLVAGGLIGAGLTIWSSRGREVDATAVMELNSERILKEVDAKFVTFGHTHEPVARQLDNGSWYFNTGTWVPTGKPGLLRAFTHLVVHHRESGPEAELCQWRDGASRSFTPGWRPGSSVENESLQHATPAAVPAHRPV